MIATIRLTSKVILQNFAWYFSHKCLLIIYELPLAPLLYLALWEYFFAGYLLHVALQLFRAGYIALLAFPGWPTWRQSPAFGYDDKRVSRSVGICLLSSIYRPLCPEVAFMWYRYSVCTLNICKKWCITHKWHTVL